MGSTFGKGVFCRISMGPAFRNPPPKYCTRAFIHNPCSAAALMGVVARYSYNYDHGTQSDAVQNAPGKVCLSPLLVARSALVGRNFPQLPLTHLNPKHQQGCKNRGGLGFPARSIRSRAPEGRMRVSGLGLYGDRIGMYFVMHGMHVVPQ